jgi:hypothetical protein
MRAILPVVRCRRRLTWEGLRPTGEKGRHISFGLRSLRFGPLDILCLSRNPRREAAPQAAIRKLDALASFQASRKRGSSVPSISSPGRDVG